MKLLTTTLVIVFLTAASAKPTGWRRHQDADIAEDDKIKGWPESINGRSWQSTESSSSNDSSSDSDQLQNSGKSSDSSSSSSSSEDSSEDSSSEESSEVVPTTAVTTVTTADRSTLIPEPDTMTTEEPTITVTTPPTILTTDVVVTSPGNVTHCVTEEIPTPAPVTENRGDN